MKNIYAGIFVLFFFLFVSCKNKTENDVDKAVAKTYLAEKVGVKGNDGYEVINAGLIKKEWEENLLSQGIRTKLQEPKIVSGLVEETSEVFYMLLAVSEDGKTKTASILTFKNDSFYFERQEEFVNNVICHSDCKDGCNPEVVMQNAIKSLVCSPCLECQKYEFELR